MRPFHPLHGTNLGEGSRGGKLHVALEMLMIGVATNLALVYAVLHVLPRFVVHIKEEEVFGDPLPPVDRKTNVSHPGCGACLGSHAQNTFAFKLLCFHA